MKKLRCLKNNPAKYHLDLIWNEGQKEQEQEQHE